MADLDSRLAADLSQATKGKLPELSTLRLIKAALNNEVIARRGKGETMTEVDKLAIVRRELKKRQEAAKLYEQGGRPELAEQELAEAKIVERYLPQAPTVEQVSEIAQQLKNELKLEGQSNRGALIKAILDHYQGAVDGRVASEAAKSVL